MYGCIDVTIVIEVGNAHDKGARLVGHIVINGFLGKEAPPEIGVALSTVIEFPGVGDGASRLAAILHVLGEQLGIGAAEAGISGAQPLAGEVHVRCDRLEARALEDGVGAEDEFVECDVATLGIGVVYIEKVGEDQAGLSHIPSGEIKGGELVVALEHALNGRRAGDVNLFGLDGA